MIKILVVDDSALMRRVIGEILKSQEDFEVEFARDGVEALAKLHSFLPDVITLDVHMPNMDGLACLDRVMVERPCRVIMMSSLTEDGADETIQAMQLGAIDFIGKPRGAVSLAIDDLRWPLIEKVRAAAKVQLRTARRLTDRIRLKALAPTAAVNNASGFVKGARPRPLMQGVSISRRPSVDTVVLVGSSTGGPPALDALLSPLPASFPWPIVIAQHMPASFTGPLARRLDRLCELKVQEVTAAVPMIPGHVYVGRGDGDIMVVMRADKAFVTAAAPLAGYPWHPSVDRLVSSAQDCLGAERLIGVLLTGMGNDGASAMAKMRAAGGRTIAESEQSAVVWGMPGELVKAGGADVVASADTIAGFLAEWAA